MLSFPPHPPHAIAPSNDMPTPVNDYERNVLANIEKYGCNVTSVFDPDGNLPPFSYSIGITMSCGAPEVIVVGLNGQLGQSLVNEYNRRAAGGETFVFDVPYLGFLEGFPVQFGPVSRQHREAYMRSACWLHDTPDFTAVQLIWPSKLGAWPWDPDASDWLRANQPILAEDAQPRS